MWRINPEGARNIMQYVRELEGKLLACRAEQKARILPFQIGSFLLGLLLGVAATMFSWLYMLHR